MRTLQKKALGNVLNNLKVDTPYITPADWNLLPILLHSLCLHGKSGGTCPTSILQAIRSKQKSFYICSLHSAMFV